MFLCTFKKIIPIKLIEGHSRSETSRDLTRPAKEKVLGESLSPISFG